jgi:hypothetical protein
MICSFRAECLNDAYKLLNRLKNQVSRVTIFPDPIYPDVEIELEGELTFSTIRRVLAQMEDSQVMLETCRKVPRIRNDMTRAE